MGEDALYREHPHERRSREAVKRHAERAEAWLMEVERRIGLSVDREHADANDACGVYAPRLSSTKLHTIMLGVEGARHVLADISARPFPNGWREEACANTLAYTGEMIPHAKSARPALRAFLLLPYPPVQSCGPAGGGLWPTLLRFSKSKKRVLANTEYACECLPESGCSGVDDAAAAYLCFLAAIWLHPCHQEECSASREGDAIGDGEVYKASVVGVGGIDRKRAYCRVEALRLRGVGYVRLKCCDVIGPEAADAGNLRVCHPHDGCGSGPRRGCRRRGMRCGHRATGQQQSQDEYQHPQNLRRAQAFYAPQVCA